MNINCCVYCPRRQARVICEEEKSPICWTFIYCVKSKPILSGLERVLRVWLFFALLPFFQFSDAKKYKTTHYFAPAVISPQLFLTFEGLVSFVYITFPLFYIAEGQVPPLPHRFLSTTILYNGPGNALSFFRSLLRVVCTRTRKNIKVTYGNYLWWLWVTYCMIIATASSPLETLHDFFHNK